MNVIERSSNDILFNHVCSERCQNRPRKKHEVLRCPVRASNDKDYERLQDISRMSAETLIDNPNLIAEF